MMMKRLKRTLTAILIAALALTYQPITAFAKVYDDDADDITCSIDSDETLDFDDIEDDFLDVCDDLTDEDLDYVKFRLPDEDEGILYYDYDDDDDDNTEVSASRKYYYDSKSPYIKRVTFVPDEDYSGTVTIKYKGYNDDDDSYSGEIKIDVDGGSKSSSDTIKYSLDYDEDYIEFDEDDFFKVCKKIQHEDLDYVKFTDLPDDDDGILYYDYDEDEDDDDNTEVRSSRKYYYDRSSYLRKVSFVPDDDFSGTLTFKYTGYDEEGDRYTGKIRITVGDRDEKKDDSEIAYKAKDRREVVNFDEDDFSDLCDDLNDEDLDYVKFSIPSAKSGILYYNYNEGQYSSVVTSSRKYYVDSSPYLGDVTFVPNDQFSGTCIIDFTGWDVDGKKFSGEVKITVGSGSVNAKTITYTGKPGTATIMKDSDFNQVCRDLMGNQLNYIYFTLPSSSEGTLYYGYTQSGNYSSKVRANTKYYYGGSPYILNISFVPERSGTVSISYTGYDVEGLSFTGTVQVNSTGTTGGSTGGSTPIDTSKLISSKYFSDVDISYSWAVPYIDSLYESNIMSGATVGTSKRYNPASYVTRGEFMLILYRALNLKTTSSAGGFIDVPAGSYYYDAVMTAQALGIAQGSYKQFHPNEKITREDAMVFVQRAVNITGSTLPAGDISGLTSFRDYSSISAYSKSAVATLVKAGIITGSDDNKIYPQGNLTRAQIAAIIFRVINE